MSTYNAQIVFIIITSKFSYLYRRVVNNILVGTSPEVTVGHRTALAASSFKLKQNEPISCVCARHLTRARAHTHTRTRAHSFSNALGINTSREDTKTISVCKLPRNRIYYIISYEHRERVQCTVHRIHIHEALTDL